MKRVTIKDIAREAGVSVGAASFALNDRAGVSEATRERVKKVAADLGWQRSAAAAALSARQAGALGMVLQRGRGDDFAETFILRFIGGVHEVLRPLNQSLVFQLVGSAEEEAATYRRWWGERRVDGVILLRPSEGDGRPELMEELGMPSVVIGGPSGGLMGSVSSDEVVTTQVLVDHFADLGHRRIGFVTGPVSRHYIHWRHEAFLARCAERGVEPTVVHVDIDLEDCGQQECAAMVAADQRPTAVLFDNELLALGGLAAFHDAGIEVGTDIAMAVYEDAPSLRMHRPAVTVLKRRSEDLGAMAAQSLIDLANGGRAKALIAPLPDLVVRASSAPPRA